MNKEVGLDFFRTHETRKGKEIRTKRCVVC